MDDYLDFIVIVVIHTIGIIMIHITIPLISVSLIFDLFKLQVIEYSLRFWLIEKN